MAKNTYEQRIRLANAELLDKGNLAVISTFFAATYKAHGGGKSHKGYAFIKRYLTQLRNAIPNLRVVKIEILASAKNTITWQRTMRGTHRAAMRGIPPSGKTIQWQDMLVTRFEGDKIAEDWLVSDLAGQLMLKLPAA